MIRGIAEIFISSPLLAFLTFIFALTFSIATFDKRMIQAKSKGTLFPNKSMLPNWVGVTSWTHWIVMISLLIINWRYAVAIFITGLIISVVPIWETIGNMLMSQFKVNK